MNTLCENSYYIASVGLIAVGLYVMVAKKNLIKVFIGLTLFETGINAVGSFRRGWWIPYLRRLC